MRPRLLDLFCGAGGCAVGYHRAGFDVVGVDIALQPRYPFAFIHDDAVTVLDWLIAGALPEIPQAPSLASFDAIHASPPCQRWTRAQNASKNSDAHPDLVTPIRELLKDIGLPYVIENVQGAPLDHPAAVCMSHLLKHDGFELRRHRYFETSFPMMSLGCGCGSYPAAPVFGHSAGRDWRRRHGRDFGAADKAAIMGIDWMNRNEVAEAVPPAFTEFIGGYLMAEINARAASRS